MRYLFVDIDMAITATDKKLGFTADCALLYKQLDKLKDYRTQLSNTELFTDKGTKDVKRIARNFDLFIKRNGILY